MSIPDDAEIVSLEALEATVNIIGQNSAAFAALKEAERRMKNGQNPIILKKGSTLYVTDAGK